MKKATVNHIRICFVFMPLVRIKETLDWVEIRKIVIVHLDCDRSLERADPGKGRVEFVLPGAHGQIAGDRQRIRTLIGDSCLAQASALGSSSPKWMSLMFRWNSTEGSGIGETDGLGSPLEAIGRSRLWPTPKAAVSREPGLAKTLRATSRLN
ncbi:hypothetical protein [Thiorhodovibrio frisius]|uniref:hypothetical protein n=1 Tax=Thiorhodovibrio frisius TaxID=631362 RepID=UPI00167FA7BA|nr:hypothetical protein [Thiorhodovibrio frisius]